MLAIEMPVAGALVHYDPRENILYIDDEWFQKLGSIYQQMCLTCKGTLKTEPGV